MKTEAQLDAEIAAELTGRADKSRVGELVICNGKPGKITDVMPSGQLVVKIGSAHVQLDPSMCGGPVGKAAAAAARRDSQAQRHTARELQTDIDQYLATRPVQKHQPEVDVFVPTPPMIPLVHRRPDPVTGKMAARVVPGVTISATPPVPRARAPRAQAPRVTTAAQLADTKPTRSEIAAAPAVVPAPTSLKGRNCLKDFLGGKSADAILASLGFMDLVKEAGGADDEGGYSRVAMPDEFDPLEVMTWTAAITRIDGFVSKKSAGEDRPSTSGIVVEVAGDLPMHPQHREKVLAMRAKYKPTPADESKGRAVLAWARALPGATDYEQNVRLIAEQPVIKASHIGTLASAISGYDREHGTAAARGVRVGGTASVWVGEIKQRLPWTLVVERIFDLEGQYGILHIHTMRDPAGNAIVWKTTSKRLDVGETVTGNGTVKAHTEYKGEKQTEITRFG